MSEELEQQRQRNPRFHACPWLVVALVLALPVLYVLSVPWVEILWLKMGFPESNVYYEYRYPYQWVLHSKWGYTLFRYSLWCGSPVSPEGCEWLGP